MTPVNISYEYIQYFLNIFSVALVIFVLATEMYEATTRENLSSGFPTKRVSNQPHWLNRLARKLKFLLVASLDMTNKKQITKLLMRLRGCPG